MMLSADGLEQAADQYLHDVLGIAATRGVGPIVGKLPYFLTESFTLRERRLLDTRLLLAIEQRNVRPMLSQLRVQLERLRDLTTLPVVYVSAALASYERKRLIQQKIPFLVPGNQLYLPDLGIDLREHFRSRPAHQDAALSPATQALLISVLLRQTWQVEWHLAEVSNRLGYTAMTLSRAVRELVSSGIGVVRVEGRMRTLHVERTASETWDYAKPLLRSPMKRRFWASSIPTSLLGRPKLAGPSALSRYSMLSEPKSTTVAMSQQDWKTAEKQFIEVFPEPIDGAIECEIWRYSTALGPFSETVDPLSLDLSLQERTDERVQLALDELRSHFPW